jgi:hypothetical protein
VRSKSLCFLLLLCWRLSAWSQDAGSQQNPPQGDGVPQQSPVQGENAPPPPPAQGGDFSTNFDAPKVPAGVIIVKGAWASSSDSQTPEPENGAIVDNVYTSKYFGLSWSLPADWFQKHEGPPPSDSGFYVLAQLQPAPTFRAPVKGTVMVSAQDLFFSVLPGNNALELAKFKGSNLGSDYTLEKRPAEMTIANRSFVRMDYMSPVAGIHWYTLTTQVRCHAVQFTLSSRDPQLLESLIQSINKMQLPAEAGATTGKGGGEYPVCIKDYASGANVLSRVDPILPPGKYNAIPVRIIIGKSGKVKHVHLLSAFPDQAKIITDALLQWEFKPYIVNGEEREVETGIMMGRGARTPSARKQAAAASD